MPSHSNSTRPEILAPAGNADMLCAAVFAGADAVYLGLQNFNARRTAGNFTTEGLRQAVAFCHARDVRVYVTLNTTLYPGELTALAEAVAGIAAAGADAVITQDLAVAALVRRMAPGLALHGSTQMSVQSLDGARRLAALGFTRVILARELTLSEIAEAAGRENEIIFGMLTPEVNDLKRFGYHPSGFINNCPEAAEVLAFLERGWGGESFHEIVNNLRTSDPYMVMADFADYRRAQNDLSGLYRDRGVWNRMSLMNIANAGIFSADRAVNDYARDIWHVKPIK